ncbi:MAG TPA: FAD-dependent oxidoreductase [Longimicrobium sp.]|nr:FAD-dependent oxidoreductase [Longimicrobium sp.]
MMEAVVVGAGVSGLSCAIRLREAGWDVRVWTADPPLETVSAVAAAIWYPYHAEPLSVACALGMRTFTVLAGLARDPESGVRLVDGVEYWNDAIPELWAESTLEPIARTPPASIPEGHTGGHRFIAPVVEMPIYLPWLVRRFEAAGGTIETRRIASLAEVEAPLVVNCTGLGASTVVPDGSMLPIRGQVVVVENPGLDEWIAAVDGDSVTYVIPRSGDCVLGGTSEKGAWSLEPDPASARSILERCIRLEPRLAGARVLAHRVGLRPWHEDGIRLESETTPGGRRIIHDYGHGGAGVTLSWGCAEEVVRLAGPPG